MKIYLAIVLASFVVVSIQSKILPKTKRENWTVPSNHRQGFRPKPVPVNGTTNITTSNQPTTRTKRNIDKNCDVMDVILLLCSSEAVHRKNWTNVLDLAKDIVSWFNLRPDAVRIGVITYSSNANITIPLGYNGNDVIKLINNIKYQGDGVDTNTAMEVMRAQFKTHTRPNVRRLCVLIDYEYGFIPDWAIEWATLARQGGIELYIIRLANYKSQEVVIATVSDLVSPMSNYEQSAGKLICGETARAMISKNNYKGNTGGSSENNWSCDIESGNICDMIEDHDTDQYDCCCS